MKNTVRRQEKCQVAELMKPPQRATSVNYAKRNHDLLKQTQVANKAKKENVPPPKKPFKLKRFEKVTSQVYNNTSERKPLSERTQERPPSQNPNYGKVPAYLEEFKNQRKAQEEQERLKNETKNCPPGMRLMLEDERQDTLQMLYKGKEEIFQAINRLPVASNTATVQRTRKEYEAKLLEIETAIKTFSRPKVYVAI